MKTLHRWIVVGALLAATIRYGQSEKPATEDLWQDGTRSVVNTVAILGVPEAVFDLVTTARFWPQWHPATMAVGGVTERPYGLGGRIYEQGRIGDLNFQVVWKVAEYTRPWRVVLQAETSLTRISYSFQAQDGAIAFTRSVEYRVDRFDPATSAPKDVEQLMQVQSGLAVKQLKALVEKILREEAIRTQ